MVLQTTFYIDNREHIAQQVAKAIPTATLTNLDLGDYKIDISGQTVLIVERKTIADYAASILDGRNREQKKRLVANYQLTQIVYLIEGDLTRDNSNFKYNKVSKETIVSSIINTMLRDNIHVFHTSGPEETVAFLKMTYEKLQKQGLEFLEKKTTHHIDLVNQVRVTKRDNITSQVVFQSMLNNIPGVSNTISSFLLEQFQNMSKFMESLLAIDTLENRILYISKFKVNNRSIPKSTATNIVNCLFC